MANNIGGKLWLIPDAYYPKISNGHFPSHESVCVLNTNNVDANIELKLYFEDKEPISGFFAKCLAQRCHHIRLDKIKSNLGDTIPQGVPYAILVESNIDVVVQYTRMDTTQPEMALMTTIAHQIK